MSKVRKFKGVINGVEYTDPKQFQEVYAAVKNFDNFTMSQQFYYEDTPDSEEDCWVNCGGVDCSGVGEDAEDAKGYTVDDFASDFVPDYKKEVDELFDSENFNKLNDTVVADRAILKNLVEKFAELRTKLTDDEKEAIAKYISDQRAKLGDDIKATEKLVDKLHDELNDIQEDIDNRFTYTRYLYNDIFRDEYRKPRRESNSVQTYLDEYQVVYKKFAKASIAKGVYEMMYDYFNELM